MPLRNRQPVNSLRVVPVSWFPDRQLDPQTVDLWHIELDVPSDVTNGMWNILDSGERERAARFRSSRQRARFIVRRAMLRLLLSAYTGWRADDLPISCKCPCGSQCHGKPKLPPEVGISFSTSSSSDTAVVGVSRTGEIGVDVELNAIEDRIVEELAISMLSTEERAKWDTLTRAERKRFGIDSWVRKEAVLKLWGCGLAIEPMAIPLTELRPGVWRASGIAAFPDCHVINLEPPLPGCAVAVAVPLFRKTMGARWLELTPRDVEEVFRAANL